jgi:hypothetical protein
MPRSNVVFGPSVIATLLMSGCGVSQTNPTPPPVASQSAVTPPADQNAIRDPITPQVEGNQRRVSRDEEQP